MGQDPVGYLGPPRGQVTKMSLRHCGREKLFAQNGTSRCLLRFSNPHVILVYYHVSKLSFPRTSLVVHWLRLQAPNAAGLGSIPGHK